MTNEQLVQMIQSRAEEVEQYQNNIDMFFIIAYGLPSELPPHLEQYRNRTDRHQAAAEIMNVDDLQTLSDVWMHDEMQARIRSEMVEMRKAMAIKTALEAQLDSQQ